MERLPTATPGYRQTPDAPDFPGSSHPPPRLPSSSRTPRYCGLIEGRLERVWLPCWLIPAQALQRAHSELDARFHHPARADLGERARDAPYHATTGGD